MMDDVEDVASVVITLDANGTATASLSGTAPDIAWLLEKARYSLYQEMAKRGYK